MCVHPQYNCQNNEKHLEDLSHNLPNVRDPEPVMIEESPCLMTSLGDLGVDSPAECNSLLNEGSSIFEMDVLDDDKDTLPKYAEGENASRTLATHVSATDEITNQGDDSLSPIHDKVSQSQIDTEETTNSYGKEDPSHIKDLHSEHANQSGVYKASSSNELQLSKKFGSEYEFRTESHCPGPPDKNAGSDESGFSRFHIPASSALITSFYFSASLGSALTEPGSLPSSGSDAEVDSPSSIQEENFGDLKHKTDTDYVDKINGNLVSSIQRSSHGLFSLDSSKLLESVLMLNCTLISQSVSVVKEEASSTFTCNTTGQFPENECEKCCENDSHRYKDAFRSHGQHKMIHTELASSHNASAMCSVDERTRQRYAWKREKEELKKKLTKQLYSSLKKGKISKKKYHQAIRRASLRCLMDKFFKNFDEVSKKDKNKLSKIINHYFNLLAYSRSRPLQTNSSTILDYPVERNTPNTLEAFFQDLVEREDATAADTMHVEWMRLRTFWSFPTNANVSTVQLARDGFFYTGHTTETRCFCCRNVYREWDETSDINAIHRRISPNCDLAHGRPTRNFAIHDQRGGFNILQRLNPETPATGQNQNPEAPAAEQNQASAPDEVPATQQSTEQSVSEDEQEQSVSEAAPSSIGKDCNKYNTFCSTNCVYRAKIFNLKLPCLLQILKCYCVISHISVHVVAKLFN
jgi:hypothetical protein